MNPRVLYTCSLRKAEPFLQSVVDSDTDSLIITSAVLLLQVLLCNLDGVLLACMHRRCIWLCDSSVCNESWCSLAEYGGFGSVAGKIETDIKINHEGEVNRCVCVYVCARVRVCVCVHVCTCVYMCMYVRVCMCVCVYICVYVCGCVHVSMCVGGCLCPCIMCDSSTCIGVCSTFGDLGDCNPCRHLLMSVHELHAKLQHVAPYPAPSQSILQSSLHASKPLHHRHQDPLH